jgi:hypothetical protein
MLLILTVSLLGAGCDVGAIDQPRLTRLDLSGTVTSSADGAPIGSATVTFNGLAEMRFVTLGTLSTAENGRFIFRPSVDCASGSYFFSVEAVGYDNYGSDRYTYLECSSRPQHFDRVLIPIPAPADD